MWIVAFMRSFSLVPEFAVFRDVCGLIWPKTGQYQNLPKRLSYCDPIHPLAVPCSALLEMITATIVNLYFYTRIIFALYIFAFCPAASEDNQSQKNKIDSARNQVAKTLVTNGIIFFLFQMPYKVISLDILLREIDGVGISSTEAKYGFVLIIGQACLFLNAVVNPYLYVFSCKHYRKAIIEALCTPKTGRVTNETSLRI